MCGIPGLLQGKSAIITGASRGIGRAIALTFAGSGANLVLNGNNLHLLRELAREAELCGAQCILAPGDISQPESAQAMAQECRERFGSLDILVNNAGINSRVPFLELSPQDWRRMLEVNLDGVFHACQACLPVMLQQAEGGSIVNISSTAGKSPHANASASYGASKAAVNALTQKLALDMGRHNIRVNAICPGPIDTDMSQQWTAEYRRQVVQAIPLSRLGTCGNVADAALFLASSMAGFITGESINVNGGTYMN